METQIKTTDNLSILMNKTISWVSDEKLQQTIKLGSSDGPYTIDISEINNVKAIAVYGTSPFMFGLTTDYTVSVIEVENMILYTPAEYNREFLSSVSITALNITSSNYEVYVYGEDE